MIFPWTVAKFGDQGSEVKGLGLGGLDFEFWVLWPSGSVPEALGPTSMADDHVQA